MAGVNINPGAGHSSIAFGEQFGAGAIGGLVGTTPPPPVQSSMLPAIVAGLAIVAIAIFLVSRR